MALLLELGNTRLKAGLLTKSGLNFLGSVRSDQLFEDSISDLFDLEDIRFQRIFVASVGSSQIEAQLFDKLKKEFGIFPHSLFSQPECCGVLNGYEEFKQLGVDRWLAIIGACAHSLQPTFIVDAGTAITVDVVIDKSHKGGFITPGLIMLENSLFKGTQNLNPIKVASVKEGSELLAINTQNAIQGGCLYMTGAYINKLLYDLESETGRRFTCIGTGGDFPKINGLLDKPFEYIEELTLLGMAEIVKNV